MATAFTEGRHNAEFLISEELGTRSRENVVIKSGAFEDGDRVLTAGMVVARHLVNAEATAVARAGNTGDGAFGEVEVETNAKKGVYQLRIIEPGSDAGTFLLFDPDGVCVSRGEVGTEHTGGHLVFEISDDTDFVSGDGFNITVLGEYQYVQLNLNVTDGSEVAAGILWEDVTAAEESDPQDQEAEPAPVAIASVLVRDCEVNSNELVWPSGASAGQKAAQLLHLSRSGIIAR